MGSNQNIWETQGEGIRRKIAIITNQILPEKSIHSCSSMHNCIGINCGTVTDTIPHLHRLLYCLQNKQVRPKCRLQKKKKKIKTKKKKQNKNKEQ